MAEISRDDIGKRVTIRLRDIDGYRDIVGYLKSTTSLVNRHGEHIEFNPEDIYIWREIKEVARTATSGAPLSLRIYEIERAASNAWLAKEVSDIDGWKFRADIGITRRANSALVLNTENHVQEVIEWYSKRKLKPAVYLIPTLHSDLDIKFAEVGFVHLLDLDVMVKDNQSHKPDFKYEVSESPSAEWLSVHGDEEIKDLLQRSPARYLSIHVEGKLVAISRVSIAEEWSTIFRLWVAPEFRGSGFGRKILEASEFESGASKISLQVSTDNEVAKNLYLTSGYKVHHTGRFRELPLKTN